MNVPVVGDEDVAEHALRPEKEDAVLAIETVGALEVGKFGGEVLAALDRRGPQRIHVIEPPDDPARVRADPAHDYGKLQPGALDQLGGGFAIAQAKHAR